MTLNCLIFYDDIAKKNRHMADLSKGARDVGRILEIKQLRANVSKSKYGIMGTEKLKTGCIKDAESNPLLIGDHKLGNFPFKKYLGDRNNEKGTAASIKETIDNRIRRLFKKIDESLDVYDHPCLVGFPTAVGLISEFETKNTA